MAVKRLLLAGGLLCVGVGVAATGVALIYPPAAVILLGLALAAAGFDLGRP